MRASVFIPTNSQPRVRIALNKDEFSHLAAGLQAPKANVEGDVIRGLLIRFSDHHGSTIKLNAGNTVEFSIMATNIRAAAGRIPATDILVIKDRSGDGPILRTDAFPREFFKQTDKNVPVHTDPAIARAKADRVFNALGTNGSMNLTELRETIQKPDAPAETTAPQAPPPPVEKPRQELPSTASKGVFDDLKQAIGLVNEYMTGMDENIVLVVENNRVKAVRKVIAFEEL